jgi:vitamin B12 transporter
MQRNAVAALLAGIMASPITAGADQTYQLDAVVVTATRTAETADETLAPVTVITHEDIVRSQAQSIEDLLRGQPGVTLSNNGGAGKTTNLYLRGTNEDHVLVLVDGVKIGSATTGFAAFQEIPLELIDRIEIVRGPRSSLYGSEAIGGVIQIFTKRGSGAARPTLAVGGGSHGTVQGAATLSGGFGSGGWYSLGLADFSTQGFNACKGSLTAGCFVIEPDKDGYSNQSGRLRAGWRFADGTEAELNWLQANGRNAYDGSYSNEARTLQQVLGTRLGFKPTDAWHVDLRAGQSEDHSDGYLNGVFQSRFDTRRNTLSWQNDVVLKPGQQVVAGVDWQNDSIDSTTSYAVTSRDNTGLFAQYLAEFGRHSLQLAGRGDDNQQFGSTTTGSVAYGYALSDDLRLTASYGNAFKAPTFNELYYPGFGNAGLHPERSHSLDLGVEGKAGWGRWSLHAYETHITDLIAYDASYIPSNIDSARITGLEAEASARVYGWDLRGNVNLLDPVDDAPGANAGKLLPRRTRSALTLGADRSFGAWSMGATLRAEGGRYDDLANRTRLAGYATVDLRAEYRLDRAWRLQGKVENLFNKDYETAYLYNQPGRGFYVMLRYQP